MLAYTFFGMALCCCSIHDVVGLASGTYSLRSVPQVVIPDNQPNQSDIHFQQEKPRRRQLMDMINAFRAEVCAKLKDEHGRNFESFHKCKEFMEEVCNPGKDKMMDGDKTEITTRKGYCSEYFAEKEAEKEVQEMDEAEKKQKDKAPAPAPAPAAPLGPAPAPTVAKGISAPAPAPFASAPGAPAAPAAPLPGDEAWYYKDGGKWPGRIHMKEDLKLPTQGYWGKLVEHEEGKTFTGDWGKEFGPSQPTFAAICRKHPESAWCRRSGHSKPAHSSGYRLVANSIALVLPLMMWISGSI